MMRSTARPLRSAMAWKMALCSESTGSKVAPASRTARSITSPAQTSASLLASAMAPPRWIAASVDGSPAAPVIAAMVQSTGMRRRRVDRGVAAVGADRMPGQRGLQRRAGAGSLITANSAPSAKACSASSGVAAANQAAHR